MKPTDPPPPKASARQVPPPPKASAGQVPPPPKAPARQGPEYDDGVPRGHAGEHHPADEMHNEAVVHEHSDINIRAIIGSGIAMVVIMGAVSVLMLGLFKFLESDAMGAKVEVSPLAAPATQMPAHIKGPAAFGSAPKPQLLTNESAVLQQLRAAESQQLLGYGWVDEKSGVARMPIAEAKKLLVERGLPAKPTSAATDPTLGTHRAATAEPSSGRTAVGPPRGAGLPEIAPSSPKPPAAAPPHKGG
jgi:hypothetical protein